MTSVIRVKHVVPRPLTAAEAEALVTAASRFLKSSNSHVSSTSPTTSEGLLRIVDWAIEVEGDAGATALVVTADRLPTSMPGTPATGRGLVSNGCMGIDLIHLDAGDRFAPHTHPGDHLLIAVSGHGTVTYGGLIYPTRAGQLYMIEGSIPHAVGAITAHVVLSVGAPHRSVDAPDRQRPTSYEAILSPDETLTCAICGVTARPPQRLSELGCPHGPIDAYRAPTGDPGP